VTHTKGTWKQSGTIIYAEDNGVICQLSEIRTDTIIYHEEVGLSSPDWPEAMANGALIAAAPELLAALEKIAAGNPAKPGEWLCDIEMADIARAAIAKAKVEVHL
jgi:hypothetical protein